ncbi:uncharacterized protein H6S33_005460 [Morchella sextelata]|uniref:uncharacterized protein n=1 Tax=Morchella sextelata TaxID=1174677 RepID=UPI001D0394B3|nr:uncharacterized protein H6S33_005460 [Morchella sextelata]KAH0613574.1 hypothetical protein H6S33_005460 [Morchella sextelata]
MPLTILILDGTDVDMCFVEECFKTTWGGAWLKELSLRKCAKIEHFDLLEWLGPAFYRNVIHGLRVLKLWGCGTLSPKGAFKPSLATGNSSGNQVNADAVNLPQNDLSGSSPDAQTPINTEAAAAPPSSGRANHATLSLTSLCRRMKINLDIGLCTMKQQCVSLQAIERAYAAQDILDAIGGVMGIPPHVRDNQLADLVVLAEKKPIKRKCCVTGCNVVIVKALCMSCEENMTCQKCQNFYCQHHASSEYLDLLCPICGPCCKNCFPTYSTECSECDQHFCNEHYPNGRCLIELDTVTGDLLLIDESEVIAEEKMVEDGQIEYQDLFPGRGRDFYFDDVWPCRLVDTDKDNFSNVDRTIDSDKEDLEDPDMVPELVDPDQDGY